MQHAPHRRLHDREELERRHHEGGARPTTAAPEELGTSDHELGTRQPRGKERRKGLLPTRGGRRQASPWPPPPARRGDGGDGGARLSAAAEEKKRGRKEEEEDEEERRRRYLNRLGT